MRWEEKFRVNSHDTDPTGAVRPSAILRYMQEAANMQLHTLGPSMERMREEDGLAFILSRFTMNLYAPLHAYEAITAESWACPSRLRTFLRCGRVLREGETVADLYSAWALVRLADHRLCSVDQYHPGFDLDLPLPAPPRFYIPASAVMETAGTRTVSFGDVDVNRHMNNTNYPDMFRGFLPGVGGDLPDGLRLTRVEMLFLREAPLGETLTIGRCPDPSVANRWLMRAVRTDGEVCTEAILTLG